MHQQIWGYKVEWKSVSRGTGGKKVEYHWFRGSEGNHESLKLEKVAGPLSGFSCVFFISNDHTWFLVPYLASLSAYFLTTWQINCEI
jgi:hypothetical protein